MDTTEIVLQSEEDARQVLDAMKSLLTQYEQVTLADLLELTGISSTFQDNKIGWVNLINIQIKSVKDGYILDLPPAKEL